MTKTSLDLAKQFNKRNDNVMRDIRKGYFEYEELSGIDSREHTQGKHKVYLLSDESYAAMEAKYSGKLRMPIGAREDLVLRGVEWALGYELERQYRVGPYRIDGYDPHTNTAYEVDEEQHTHGTRIERDQERQRFITENLKCKFKRIGI